jgi:hypothetical protein
MFKRLIVLGSSAFLALAGLVPARAAVIDTFFFLELERLERIWRRVLGKVYGNR